MLDPASPRAPHDPHDPQAPPPGAPSPGAPSEPGASAASTPAPPITARPIAGALGAELHGVDLTRTPSDALIAAIRAALLEHQVVFLRDQPITPAQHEAFAARFGVLQPHPAYPTVPDHPAVTILHHTRERPSKIEKWHADMTFKARPPLGSILHARLLPPHGGDTLFASMTAAYEALSDRMQRLLDGLEAVHDFAWGFKESLAEPGGRQRLAPALADNPPVTHPVVRTHPETGARALFVNTLFTTQIVGMRERESDAILRFLHEHAIQPEFTCRFRWSVDAIAFWDNRVTQHRPINDYWPHERRMQRVTIEGDRPSFEP